MTARRVLSSADFCLELSRRWICAPARGDLVARRAAQNTADRGAHACCAPRFLPSSLPPPSGGEAARAACDPGAGGNVTATCTGTTIDQNAPHGYGTGAETNLNVTVVPGASVHGDERRHQLQYTAASPTPAPSRGSFRGIVASTATVSNSGTISGGSNGHQRRHRQCDQFRHHLGGRHRHPFAAHRQREQFRHHLGG